MRLSNIMLAVAGAGLALAVGGCSPAGSRSTDSESHWFVSCNTDAACSAELQCLCGVCTRPCDTDGECAGATGQCLETGAVDACGASGVVRVCGVACGSDGECGGGGTCGGGALRGRGGRERRVARRHRWARLRHRRRGGGRLHC